MEIRRPEVEIDTGFSAEADYDPLKPLETGQPEQNIADRDKRTRRGELPN